MAIQLGQERERAVRAELEGSLGRTPTHPELAQALGVDEDTLERLLCLEEANRF